MNNVNIRKIHSGDYNAIWDIFHDVIKTGDTYVFPPDMKREEALSYWIGDKYFTYVAEVDGKVLGTYIIKQNQIGLGSHVANASYMVSPKAHGKGIGKAMAQDSIQKAKDMGFKSIQFNIVVSTNDSAIGLWKKMGFSIIGTIPNGFNHKQLGLVDAHIMYKSL